MMKYMTPILLPLAATAGISHAATVLASADFSTLPDGTVTDTTSISGIGSGTWDGGTSNVSGGVVDTTTTDGYVNFTSAGFNMDLAGGNTYTFTATIDPGTLSGQRGGLFGQIGSWTSSTTEWWVRIQDSTNDTVFLLRDTSGNQVVANFDTSAALSADGTHVLEFTIDSSSISATVNGVAQSGTADTSSLTNTIGDASGRMVMGAYNSTDSNRFDGLASSYVISVVPEPSSAALLGLGGLSLILCRRR
ncbi:PEP-CTERM sorting domain-containing protein [Verrucomicrobiaceae bacterium N1E253]|uniref:PEP-CTERM sorting domain-containing protein n=1 Tax=Oceaniferula marina TaxID=2748318 RepID=A0A851GC64_9BACT|nr:PEP-CTERM sorting domain-containing protein [Oceaniferula marina]NWK54769.1 PEP-CTERM sorting domain-containing protein [Oceaniferula marina]